jgi:crossover junction endodeoxyribonuclease RusA
MATIQELQTGDVLDFTVYGRAYPKGSLRHVGGGRLREELKGSEPWRKAVAAAAVEAMRFEEDSFPITKPQAVAVNIYLEFRRPKSTPAERAPVTRSTGDIDKLCRNILDALTDAGVVEDDSQVILLEARKDYLPDSNWPESARIMVRRA